MAPPRFVPSDQTLEKWLDEGLTHKEIQARIKEQDGVEVALGTISAAISRAGLTSMNRFDKLIPSPVREDHQGAYPLVMLRLLGRRQQGEELTQDQAKRLDSWTARLDSEDACVAYRRDTADGWLYVKKRKQDAGKYSRLD
jgi:hypothetical protein